MGVINGNKHVMTGNLPPPTPENQADLASAPVRPRWQRVLWALTGGIALALGVIGIVLPLLPTTPFVLLAAFSFARSSVRYEHWLLTHPRFGPMVHDWRAYRAVPLRAKQLAWVMMVASWRWLGGRCLRACTGYRQLAARWWPCGCGACPRALKRRRMATKQHEFFS